MRSRFLLLFFSLASHCYSQGWAPTGAKWHYTQISFTGPLITFSIVESLADTVIQGKNCKKMSNGGGCSFYGPYFFIYSDSGKVFVYDNYYSTFSLLYDFNLSQGDSWVVHPYSQGTISDSLIVSVDSIGTQIINSDTLKVMYTTATASPTFGIWSWGGKMIDRIGSIGYFLPQVGFCDPPAGPLRCYDDSIIGHYETGFAASCTWTNVGISEYNFEDLISIFPNHSKGIFTISSSEDLKEIEIVDILGNSVFKRTINSKLETLNFFQPKGIYFVKVKDEKGNFVVKKILIQ